MMQTTLCYIELGGCYLMLHRTKKENDVNHDKWIGVGGKFEANEAPEECLLREAREETGLLLTHYTYRGLLTFLYNDKEPEYIFTYTADGFVQSGTGYGKAASSVQNPVFPASLPDCREGVLEWVSKNRIDRLTLWEGDHLLFRLLQENRSVPFSLKMRYRGDDLLEALELSEGVRILKPMRA